MLLKGRIERSASLPLYYARYLNAFKLMISLSDQKKIVGASFGKKLREALLPGGTNKSG
ncbi:hypothetical protein [Mesorhizobium sp.]|uniref:hypothetical protein n=1 Tax=Mesorhizobium sp. TaxID=1871066 RepID=UPI00257F165B|nr:hypothetical protein [Mesorhizobium sp.]